MVCTRRTPKAIKATTAKATTNASPPVPTKKGKSKTAPQAQQKKLDVFVTCLEEGVSTITPAYTIDEDMFVGKRGWVHLLKHFRAGHRRVLGPNAFPMKLYPAGGRKCRVRLAKGKRKGKYKEARCLKQARCGTGLCTKHAIEYGQGCESDHSHAKPCKTGVQGLNAAGFRLCQRCSRKKIGMLSGTPLAKALKNLASTLLLSVKMTEPAASKSGKLEMLARFRGDDASNGEWLSLEEMKAHSNQVISKAPDQLIHLVREARDQGCLTQPGSFARVSKGVKDTVQVETLVDGEWLAVGVPVPPLMLGGGGEGAVLIAEGWEGGKGEGMAPREVEEEGEEMRQGSDGLDFEGLDSTAFLEWLLFQGGEVDSACLLSEVYAREQRSSRSNVVEEFVMTVGKEAPEEEEGEEGERNASEKEGGQGMDVDEASEVENMVNRQEEEEEEREDVRLSRLLGVLGEEDLMSCLRLLTEKDASPIVFEEEGPLSTFQTGEDAGSNYFKEQEAEMMKRCMESAMKVKAAALVPETQVDEVGTLLASGGEEGGDNLAAPMEEGGEEAEASGDGLSGDVGMGHGGEKGQDTKTAAVSVLDFLWDGKEGEKGEEEGGDEAAMELWENPMSIEVA